MQTSIFWPTTGVGDGASDYTSTQLITWIRRMLGSGVHPNYGNELAVSGVASPLSVGYGAAIVNGFPYDATQDAAPYSVTVPTPTTGTTGHIVTVRAVWATQLVRLALRSSADGTAAFPAVVVNEGVESEILLAQLTITTGGVITVTDARDFLYFHTLVDADMITSLPSKVRTLWIPPLGGQEVISGNAVDLFDGTVSLSATLAMIGFGTFICPTDYASGMTIKPRFIPSLTGPVRLRQEYQFGAVGEASNHDTVTPSSETVAATSTILFDAGATTIPSITAGDYVTCLITRDPTDVADTNAGPLALTGFVVTYTASS